MSRFRSATLAIFFLLLFVILAHLGVRAEVMEVAGRDGRTVAITDTAPVVYLPLILNNYPPPDVPYVWRTISLSGNDQSQVNALNAVHHPHGIALDLAGKRAFVGNHLSNTLAVINTADWHITGFIPLPGADGPNGVAYDPATDRVYVANRNSANVSVIDPTNMQFVQNIPVGLLPNGVVVQDGVVYVADTGSDTISLIDAQTQVLTDTLAIDVQPALLTANDNRGFVYAASYGGNSIVYLRDGRIWNRRPNVERPYGITFDPITFRAYAVNRAIAKVTLVDVNPNWLAGTIDTGREGFVTAINPRTGHLFVVMGDRVQVYDRRDNAIIARIFVGSGAEEGIAVDPERNLVYVTSGDSDTISVIRDIPTYDIAYARWLQSATYLTIMEDTGVHRRNLGTPAELIHHLSWRPDGKVLAYRLDRNGEADIWRIEAGGTNENNMTRDILGTRDELPDWSPEGEWVAWVRDGRIWKMNDYGLNKTQLTSEAQTIKDLAWSPDGQWLAYEGVVDLHTGDRDIYLLPATGGTPLNLTDNPAYDGSLSWSPDSTKLAFTSNRDGNSEIYLLDISDLNNLVLTRLTDDPASDFSPFWSNDGRQIAFQSYRNNSNGPTVYLMDADGGNQRALTGPTEFLAWLVWSPDDQWLLTYTLGGAVPSQIYKINTVTGEQIPLTDDVYTNLWPVWRPDTWE